MKALTLLLISALFLPAFAAGKTATPVSERENAIIRLRLCPLPKNADFSDGGLILKKETGVEITTASALSDAETKRIETLFSEYWKIVPRLVFSTNAECAKLSEDGYKISIDESKISIAARDSRAVRQSLKTLRQLAEAERGGNSFFFNSAEISDYPSIKFRGIHLCLFSETSLTELEKYVRLASYYKFNYIVIEPWGVFPFSSHPEFAFADKKVDAKKLKEIITLCHTLDITPIPQFSILGHAALASNTIMKHAVLSVHPELAELYEPSGWTYCMSNPKTKIVLKEILTELIEFYDNPPFFLIGCDEAYDKGNCYKCRKQNPTDLFANYLNDFSEFLKARNIRPIMWHDMLIEKKDPRWAMQVANGDSEAPRLLEKISKDIIIADWQYSYKDVNQTEFPTPKYFKSAGFDVLVCPWWAEKGIYALAKCAEKESLFGYLGTTWHYLAGQKPAAFFYSGANASWNAGQIEGAYKPRMTLMEHLITIDRDAGITKYEELGTSNNQRSRNYWDIK